MNQQMSSAAIAVAGFHGNGASPIQADVRAVVLRTRLDVPPPPAPMVIWAGLKAQVGTWTSAAFLPVTVQLRLTAPVNPPPAATMTVVVLDWPALRAPLGTDALNASESVCPVPLEHPAVHVIVKGADGPEEMKFVSPL